MWLIGSSGCHRTRLPGCCYRRCRHYHHHHHRDCQRPRHHRCHQHRRQSHRVDLCCRPRPPMHSLPSHRPGAEARANGADAVAAADGCGGVHAHGGRERATSRTPADSAPCRCTPHRHAPLLLLLLLLLPLPLPPRRHRGPPGACACACARVRAHERARVRERACARSTPSEHGPRCAPSTDGGSSRPRSRRCWRSRSYRCPVRPARHYPADQPHRHPQPHHRHCHCHCHRHCHCPPCSTAIHSTASVTATSGSAIGT